MKLSDVLGWVTGRAGAKAQAVKNEEARAELKANAEKALNLKKLADEPKIPPHQTSHEGMRPSNDPHASDATRGAEAGFTPQLKRSRVARSGDAS